MARRKGGSDITVDIFNFLGVVKNLLGVLMVIIIGLAVGASESSGSSGSDSGEDATTTQPADTQPAPPKKAPDIPEGYTAQEAQGLVELIAQAIVVQKLVNASADHPDPATELKSLQGDISRLTLELKNLKDEARDRDITPAAPSKYELAPGKPGENTTVSRFHPAYVECTDYALLVHPLANAAELGGVSSENLVFREGGDVQRIRRADIDGPRFRRFLESLKAGGANGVLFLIRPDGVLTFRLAQSITDDLKIRSERLAVPGFEPIDLGMFGAAGR